MNLKPTDSILVTKKNAGHVARELKKGSGLILIAEAGHRSFPPDHIFDATFELFYDPRFEDDSVLAGWGSAWVAHRQKEMSAKQARDRHYWLRKKDEPSGDALWDSLVDSVENLALNEAYRFEINNQPVVSRGFLSKKGLTFFIPCMAAFGVCFAYALRMMVAKINAQAQKRGETDFLITNENIEKILAYVLEDLRTGKVLKSNIEHGQVADAILGMG